MIQRSTLSERAHVAGFATAFIAWGYLDKPIYGIFGNTDFGYWALFIGGYSLFVAALAYLAHRGDISTTSFLGHPSISGKISAQDTLLCLMVFLVIALFLKELLALALDMGHALINLTGGVAPGLRAAGRGILFCLGLTLASLLEEVVYRAMLFRLIVHKRSYVVGSAILFAGAHYGQGALGIAVALAMGLAAASIFVRIRSVVPLAIGHAATNIVLFVAK